jgi:hypothetical protein
MTSKFEEQVAAHAGQQMVVLERAFAGQGVDGMMGDGVSAASWSYSRTICRQSVASAVRARAWHAAIDACKA